MTFQELESYWAFFLCLEGDLDNTYRYLEPNGQEDAYSFEFLKIITLACAEIEMAFKEICACIDKSKKVGDISKYKELILQKYPKICDALVIIPRWNAKNIRPFENWDKGRLPWWDAYQHIKHNRHTSFKEATYKHAVYSLASLYILIQYLYKITGYECKADDSKYFYSDYCHQPICGNTHEELPDFTDMEEKE